MIDKCNTIQDFREGLGWIEEIKSNTLLVTVKAYFREVLKDRGLKLIAEGTEIVVNEN